MGTTTFSGSIKSGPIKETSGTTVGSNIKNTGFVFLSQTTAMAQTATTTTTKNINPPNRHCTQTTITLHTTRTAGAIQGNAVGIVAASPGTDATRTSKWLNTGTGDHRLIVTTANTGNGVGAVTVVYAPSNNVT